MAKQKKQSRNQQKTDPAERAQEQGQHSTDSPAHSSPSQVSPSQVARKQKNQHFGHN